MAESTLGFTLSTTIALPGSVGGHGDWVTFDAATNTVWLAQSPDNNVVVINANTNTIAATIPNIGNANGIALTSQYAFVADVTNDTLDVINKTTYQVVARVPVPGTTPDGVVYIPTTNEIAVASDDANMEYFYNATTFALTATLQLQPNPAVAGPDVALYVPSTNLLYQPDDGYEDVINPQTHAIVATWNLLGTTGDVKPSVYDPVTNTFIVGTTIDEMLVVNGTTGAVESTIKIPGSVDETAIDVNARLAYVADKAGVVDLINLDSDTLVGQLPTQTNAHTLTLDPSTDTVYMYEYNNTVSVFTPPAITADTVYRFFNTTNGNHFFTSSAAEANNLLATQPSMVEETSNFGAIDPSSNDSAATSVYRFFDTSNGTHFYTASTAELNAVKGLANYTYEGIAFNEDSTLQAGDRAVYRFFDQANGSHFYTADLNEQASLSAAGSGYTAEGIAFYAPSTVNVSAAANVS